MTTKRPRPTARQLAAAKRRYEAANAEARSLEVQAQVARSTAQLALAHWLALVEPLAAQALKGQR